MLKSLALGILLSLALAIPASAATTKLVASPNPASWGTIPVGSCNLETFDGCVVKTITITNVSSVKVRIRAIAVHGADVGLDPRGSQTGDCTRLPIGDKGWGLKAGQSCTVRVSMAPSVINEGGVTSSLVLYNPKGRALVTVLLLGQGV